MMLLKYNFFRASILHLTKDIDSISDHAAQIFLSEKLLNNAFNSPVCIKIDVVSEEWLQWLGLK